MGPERARPTPDEPPVRDEETQEVGEMTMIPLVGHVAVAAAREAEGDALDPMSEALGYAPEPVLRRETFRVLPAPLPPVPKDLIHRSRQRTRRSR